MPQVPSAGLPALARINPGNDLEAVVNDEGVGFAVAGESMDALTARAERLSADSELRRGMSERGRALADRMVSPASAVRQIIDGLAGREY